MCMWASELIRRMCFLWPWRRRGRGGPLAEPDSGSTAKLLLIQPRRLQSYADELPSRTLPTIEAMTPMAGYVYWCDQQDTEFLDESDEVLVVDSYEELARRSIEVIERNTAAFEWIEAVNRHEAELAEHIERIERLAELVEHIEELVERTDGPSSGKRYLTEAMLQTTVRVENRPQSSCQCPTRDAKEAAALDAAWRANKAALRDALIEIYAEVARSVSKRAAEHVYPDIEQWSLDLQTKAATGGCLVQKGRHRWRRKRRRRELLLFRATPGEDRTTKYGALGELTSSSGGLADAA